MALLETQINQIYLTHPGTKKILLVLYEESLSASAHLFFLCELADIKTKAQALDLKKISEIVLRVFKANKKLPAESLFESSLAAINQSLADLSGSGHKSWLGKFSAMIALKSSNAILISNTGQTTALLRRKSELIPILKPEKSGSHPLKTFLNFTAGKLKECDQLLLLTSSIFNYISLPLVAKILQEQNLKQATVSLSKILQDSANNDSAFAAFFLEFGKETIAEQNRQFEEIYAPLPEEMEQEVKRKRISFGNLFSLSALPKLRRFKLFKSGFFANLSRAGKFFFLSFTIFLALLLINVTVFAVKNRAQKSQNKIQSQISLINKDIDDANSALIYKNEKEALKFLKQAQADWQVLKSLDLDQALEFELKLSNLGDKIAHKTVIETPKVFLSLKHTPTDVIKAGNTFVFANQSSNTISVFDGKDLNDLFLLNNTDSSLRGLAHVALNGTFVATKNSLYLINQDAKQFDRLYSSPSSDFARLEFLGPNRLYAINQANGQVTRFNIDKQKVTSAQIAISDLAKNIQDIGIDSNIYLLYPDQIKKYNNGRQASFTLSDLPESMSAASRLFVASNLYVLESEKKRLLIFNKAGALINQIYFPNSSNLKDLYVDETNRNIYLLDSDKLLQITF